MFKIRYLFSIILLLIFSINTQLFSLSTAMKTRNDYAFTLNVLREMETMVKNFPVKEVNEKFRTIKKQFQKAGELHFGQEYSKSYTIFIDLKSNLISLLEGISKNYLERTKIILDSTSKDSFDIFIDFSSKSSLAYYFKKPFDIFNDVKPYTKKNNAGKKSDDVNAPRHYGPDDYHFFKDKEPIRRYLHRGYKKYNYAINLFADPEILIVKDKMKTRKNISSRSLSFIIDRYLKIIDLCREAKQYGIEIHKVMNPNEVGLILKKYDISMRKMTPIFDDRIPEKFKIDAIDNIGLIFKIEEERKKKRMNKIKN